MFYYISFLRPPPTQAAISGEPIFITPQIANDLRTEYYTGVQDIFYSWSLHSPKPNSPVITKPVKLTSWRASTMYKEIPVPPPRNARNGEYWRLILSPGTSRKDQALSLNDEDLGRQPFAVLSDPIFFSTRPSKTAKQELIQRSYNLTATRDTPAIFHIVEQTSFDLDKKIWDSGIGLSSWLVRLHSGIFANTALVSIVKNVLFASKCDILEIGAGTGIVAIVLGILRGLLDSPGKSGKIVTTDLPSALPLLQTNIMLNQSLYLHNAPEAAVLDWDEPEIPTKVQSFATGIDVIVMADVTYNTSSFPSLIGTLSRLIRFSMSAAPAKAPLIILGYKERDAAERTLWDIAEKIGIHFEEVAKVPGADEFPVEVWVGTAAVDT